MKADINFDCCINPEVSQDIASLADMLIDELGSKVQVLKKDVKPGVKDGGLIAGLTIFGVTLASVNTLINILNYWRSLKIHYSVTIKDGDLSISIASLKKDEIKGLLEKVSATNSNFKVLISRAF